MSYRWCQSSKLCVIGTKNIKSVFIHGWTIFKKMKIMKSKAGGQGPHDPRRVLGKALARGLGGWNQKFTERRITYFWWFSSTLTGEVAYLRSQSCITGVWSSSDDRHICVATSGFQLTSLHLICRIFDTKILKHALYIHGEQSENP